MTFLDRVQTDEGADLVRKAAWTILALSLLAFVVRGATRPADPFVLVREPLPGFEEISFTVTGPGGGIGEWCALLAANEQARAQGLMNQRDLRGYDGMVFRYDAPSSGGMWMKDTLIPLSVAYFDEQGLFINAHAMEPCPPDAVDCPTYPPAKPFLHAVEVPKGNIGRLGIGPGSTIGFSGKPCPS